MFGSAALVVVGEPTSEQHKNAILDRVTQGFASWDNESTGCDINAELLSIFTESPCGVAGSNGEHVVKHGSEVFQLEILVNPRRETLADALRVLLLPPTKHKHVIFAGYSFTGTGDWILQDGTWSADDFHRICKQKDVELALNEQTDSTLTIHQGAACGQWTEEKMQKSIVGQNLRVSVNPEQRLDNLDTVIQFTTYLSCFVKVTSTYELLQMSQIVGNIRFSKPTLYIFPGSQGDCAVFGVHGFNMLLDGGYSKRSCFWEFTRHLDRLDVLLVSRITQDNVFGMKAFLSRCIEEELVHPQSKLHPEITYSFFNHVVPVKGKDKELSSPLSVSLVEESSLVGSYLRNLDCKPGLAHTSPNPIRLFHKIGHGTLEMYVLNPNKESPDYKEMMKQWSNTAEHFSNNKAGSPLPDSCSMAVLLVWKSHSGEVIRILYPGSTPQPDLLKAIDSLKDLDLFKYPNGSKTAAKAPRASVALSKASPRQQTPEIPQPSFTNTPTRCAEPEPRQPVQSGIIAPPEDLMTDLPAEQLPDLVTGDESGSLPSSTPRDAWVESNEPVSLPEPGQADLLLPSEVPLTEPVDKQEVIDEMPQHPPKFTDESLHDFEQHLNGTESQDEDPLKPAVDVSGIADDQGAADEQESSIKPDQDEETELTDEEAGEDVIESAEDKTVPEGDIVEPRTDETMEEEIPKSVVNELEEFPIPSGNAPFDSQSLDADGSELHTEYVGEQLEEPVATDPLTSADSVEKQAFLEFAPDDHKPTEHQIEKQAPDEYLSEEHAPDEYLSEEHAPDESLSEEHAPAEHLSEEQAPAESLSDEHAPAESLSEEHAPAESLSEEHASDESLSEDHAPAEHLLEEQAPAESFSEEQAPVEPLSEERVPVDYSSEEQAPVDYSSEDRTSFDRQLEGQAQSEHLPDAAKVVQDMPAEQDSSKFLLDEQLSSDRLSEVQASLDQQVKEQDSFDQLLQEQTLCEHLPNEQVEQKTLDEQAPFEELPDEQTPLAPLPDEHAMAEHFSHEQVASEMLSEEQMPSEHLLEEQPSFEQPPVEQAPCQQLPGEQSPLEQSPCQQLPGEQALENLSDKQEETSNEPSTVKQPLQGEPVADGQTQEQQYSTEYGQDESSSLNSLVNTEETFSVDPLSAHASQLDQEMNAKPLEEYLSDEDLTPCADVPVTGGDQQSFPTVSDAFQSMPVEQDAMPGFNADQAVLDEFNSSQNVIAARDPEQDVSAAPFSPSMSSDPGMAADVANDREGDDEGVIREKPTLMSSSEEDLYRHMAANEEPLIAVVPEARADLSNNTLEDNKDFSDSMEQSGSADGRSREDSLEPSSHFAEHSARDTASQLRRGESETSDPMTCSFIDDSHQDQTEDDPSGPIPDAMTASFREEKVDDIDLSRDTDPMTGSFVEMAAPADAMIRSFNMDSATPSAVDACSTKSLLGSTPALSEADSAQDNSPSDSAALTASGTNAELLSGWVDDSCAGCQNQVEHDHSSTKEPSPAPRVFDPLRDWGEPQSLPLPPSPTPVEAAAESGAAQAKGGAAKSTTPSASADKKKPLLKAANGTKASPKVRSTGLSNRPATSKAPAADEVRPRKAAASGPSNGPPKKTSSASSARVPLSKKTTSDAANKRLAAGDAAASPGDKAPTKPTRSGLAKPSKPSQSAVKTERPASKSLAEPKRPAGSARGALKEKPKAKPAAKDDVAKPKAPEKKGEVKAKPAVVDKVKTEARKPKVADEAPKKPKTLLTRPKTGTTRSPAQAKAASAKGATPFYLDLAYVPNYGGNKCVGAEFFQHIHARYYVFSGHNHRMEPYDALLSGKETWPADPVTLIPTYDTTEFSHWLADHTDDLARLNITVAMSAARCIIQLTEGNSNFPAFRLEF
ncbi:microtubule-associated protein futsch-like isoform X2 [Watersipora subatra]|uniref:microtubule-associated protein futsch-like isoform X2 n=1 Tax=Watersipora subatra TaxID=2589382 RepID=UPI00355BAB30